MGAYLYKPITDKESSDDFNEFLVCGASSMQGWRNNQEDAHNCILNFDDHASFFAVYDGHGGNEVAVYCSKYLPNLLKELQEYKDGDLDKALQTAFLQIDKDLLKTEVIEELKTIAMANEDSETEKGEDEEGLAQLCREGRMPLAAVLEKYKASEMKKKMGGGEEDENLDELYKEGQMPLVDVLHKYKGTGDKNDVDNSTSGDQPGSSKDAINNDGESACSSSSSSTAQKKPNDENISSSSSGIHSIEKNSTSSESPDCSSSNSKPEVNHVESSTGDSGGGGSSSTINGINTEPKVDEGVSSSVGGSSSAVGSGESTASVTTSSSSAEAPNSSSPKNMPILGPKVKRSSAPMDLKDTEQDSSDESEDDEEFDGKLRSEWEDIDEDDDDDDDLDDDEGEDMEADDEEDTESDDDELDEEDEDAEENAAFIENIIEEPGKDSGCTAVVALLKGFELYVANAGDSRCVVCRDGIALEMSIDHKPEDEPEHNRITKAGGRVTTEGRVNGGLNLSRAIGDHAYKMNEALKPEEQMISALPDIKKVTLSDKDSFMILACDGIWNSLSSEAVCDFIKKRLGKHEKLSKICEELFDSCLASNTCGDGTGCDNMTAIIVKFKHESNGKMDIDELGTATTTPITTTTVATKRPATTDPVVDGTPDESVKRAKTDCVGDTDDKITSSDGDVVVTDTTTAEVVAETPVTSSS